MNIVINIPSCKAIILNGNKSLYPSLLRSKTRLGKIKSPIVEYEHNVQFTIAQLKSILFWLKIANGKRAQNGLQKYAKMTPQGTKIASMTAKKVPKKNTPVHNNTNLGIENPNNPASF